MDSKQIATTILEQLGKNRFIVMTGAKNLIGLKSGLSFKIGRNAGNVNHVEIVYDQGSDLYDMKFERVSVSKKTYEVSRKLIAEYKQVYADQLQALFTEATGMYTSL